MYDYYFIFVDKNPADISVTERGKKEISFRSLDVFLSHAHRNCNNFIFYSGTLWKYMVDSLWMYLYVCNNVFILFKYKLFYLIKITGLEHSIISTFVFLDIESCFFFSIFTIMYVCIYICRGWCMRGMSLYNQVRIAHKGRWKLRKKIMSKGIQVR